MVETKENKQIILERARSFLINDSIAILVVIVILILIGTNMTGYFVSLICFGLLFSIHPFINLCQIFADLIFGKVNTIKGTLINKSKQTRGNGRGSFIIVSELGIVEDDKMTKLEIFIPEYDFELLEVGNEYKILVSKYSKIYIKSIRCIMD